MKTYRVELRPKARKQLRDLDTASRARVLGAIELLRTDPVPPNARRLKGRSDYRIRVGDYRLIYKFNAGKLIILVIAIGHRRDVYRKSE
ncbi:MAG: type II toxin-antitoxin system RelE/ParE family toxin [Actinobacteria bacterium]|nr:type II toxin-antitoxin system RelE/ParE family toxin [Actinomycetota bacterium]